MSEPVTLYAVGNRWWTRPFGLPPSADDGLPEITANQVLVARVNLVLIPLLAIALGRVTGTWPLLLLAAAPFFHVFVIAPPSHRRRILGLKS